jgi:hypothetical protein
MRIAVLPLVAVLACYDARHASVELPRNPAGAECFAACPATGPGAVACVARCPGAVVDDSRCRDGDPACVETRSLSTWKTGGIAVGLILLGVAVAR